MSRSNSKEEAKMTFHSKRNMTELGSLLRADSILFPLDSQSLNKFQEDLKSCTKIHQAFSFFENSMPSAFFQKKSSANSKDQLKAFDKESQSKCQIFLFKLAVEKQVPFENPYDVPELSKKLQHISMAILQKILNHSFLKEVLQGKQKEIPNLGLQIEISFDYCCLFLQEYLKHVSEDFRNDLVSLIKSSVDTILNSSEEVLLRQFGEEGHLFLEKLFFGLIRTLGALIDSWPITENMKRTLSCYKRLQSMLNASFKNFKVAF